MDVHLGSKDGPTPSWEAVADQFDQEIGAKQVGWQETLAADPSRFGQVEEEIQLTFSKLADQTIAAMLVRASERPQMQAHQKKRWSHRLSRFVGRKSVR